MNKKKYKFLDHKPDVIIGLDPSIARSGLVTYHVPSKIFDAFNYIPTKSSEDMGKRLSDIYRVIDSRAQVYSESIDRTIIVKEALPMQQGRFTTIKTLQGLAKVHGIIEFIAEERKLDVFDVHVTTIKHRVGGHGGASKQEIQDVVNEYFQTNITDDDVSDAMAAVMGFMISHDIEVHKELKRLRKKKYVTKAAQQKQQNKIEHMESLLFHIDPEKKDVQ